MILTTHRYFHWFCSSVMVSLICLGGLFQPSLSYAAITPVGSDQGNIEVTSNGQAVWTLPITVPPGVRGVAPNLSLSVSAQGQLNIGGLSSISRCAGLAVDHGVTAPVRYLSSDQYCMDGRPLKLINGTQGQAGSVYGTQLDSFEKVEAIGTGVNGPLSFKVTTRSGGTLTFGRTTLSKIPRASDGTVISWAVSSLEDVSGNGLWYIYSDISGSAVPEIALTQIRYGSQNQTNAPVSVDFDYESRPDTASGYQLGSVVQSTKRLKQISTTADNKIARRFKITYAQSDFGGTSRVTRIHECAVDTNDNDREKCYRPSRFDYAPVQTGWQNASISAPSPLQDSQGRSRGVVLDINNDGFNDWIIAVQPETGSAIVETWLGSADGWSSSSAFTLPGPLFDYAINNEGIPVGNLADMNGDGLIDYFQATLQYHADGSNTAKRTTWLNTGTGFEISSELQPPYYTVVIGRTGVVQAYEKYVDINGDGLPDAVRALRRKSGAFSRLTRLNTGSGWQISTGYKLDTGLFSDHTIGSEGVYQGELIDINGDGLVDFVESAKVSETDIRNRTYMNTGIGWSESPSYQLPIVLMDYSVHDKGIPNAELVDVNGDGLLDIWQALAFDTGGTAFNVWLNTGDGFVHSNHYTPIVRGTTVLGSGAVLKYGELMDVSGDGKPEFVIHALDESSTDNPVPLSVYEHSGTAWVRNDALKSLLPSIPFYLQPSDTTHSSRSMLQLADLDGDGSPEAFMSMDTVNGWQVKSSVGTLDNGMQPGYLTSHTNGLGIETRIEYGLSTDPTLYNPGDSTQNTRVSAAVNSPMVLVKAIQKMDGLVLPDTAKSNDGSSGWYRVEHQYGGLKANLEGRGSLGFQTRTITDERTGLMVASEFYQEYPFTGQSKTVKKYLNNTLLSETVTSIDQRDLNNGKTIFAYSPSIVVKQYDPDSATLLSTSTTSSVYDDFGNTISKTQTVSGTDQTFETVTTTTYENKTSGDSWILGLPTETTVTVKAPNQPDQSNITTAQYNDNGFPITEVLQPGYPQSVTTTYEYDSFGNVISTTLTSGNESRTSTVGYSSDGRFPVSSTNPLGHTGTVTVDSRWGKPISQINANQLEQKTIYDAFGTVLREDALWDGQTQAKEVALAYWCNSTSDCPANAVYFVTALDDQGESPQTVYFDAYGRELLKKTTGADLDGNETLNGPSLYIATGYDNLGRKIKTSRPGTSEATLDYEQVSYDALDRVRTKTATDGTETSIDYDGFTVITTNAKGQVTKITNDLRGKPILSVDADSNSTRYEYDAKGNLTKTVDSAGNEIVLNYDIFGRKTSMDDPDMGHWEYQYDGFGNLTQQTDAKGQVVNMVYDKLDRLTSRSEAEGTTTWTYDSAPLGNSGRNAIGMLASVNAGHEGYSRQHEYDSSGRPVKESINIKGQGYISERGYYRATDRVAWERYPSGLVLTKDYDPTGFPMKLNSVDLSDYQAYLTEYYKYEDRVQEARVAEAEHQQQLDEYRELLLGGRTGEDTEGNPEYAGGGLEDQVKAKTDLINGAVSNANTWQSYARDAANVLNEHAQWSQDYYAEYQRYRGPYDQNIAIARDYEQQALVAGRESDHHRNLSNQEADKAQPHLNAAANYQRIANAWLNKAKTDLQAGCKAAGRDLHDGPLAEFARLCRDGKGPLPGLGDGRRNVCWSLIQTDNARDGDRVTHKCTRTVNAFSWLPYTTQTYYEKTGRSYVCPNGSSQPPVGGGGGNGVDAGHPFDQTIRSLVQGVLNALIQSSYAARDDQCYWRNNYQRKTALLLKRVSSLTAAKMRHVESYIDNYNGNVTKSNQEAERANQFISRANNYANMANYHANRANSLANTANSYVDKANTYVRGMTVYGAMASNHSLVALLLNDDKGDNNPANDTGRYAHYKKQVEKYAGVWQCKKIGTAPLISGTYINGTNLTAAQKANYDDPNAGPFKSVPAGFGAASLMSWDSDDDGQKERWYINHVTQKMVQAEKLPIYKQDHCKSGELWAQTSYGEIGTYLNQLYTQSPFFYRNYVYYRFKELIDPINQLIEDANTQYELVQTKETEYKASSTTYWEALAYSEDGQIKQARYGNGVESSWDYDARGRTTGIQAKQGSNELQKQFFDYDVLGNLEKRDDFVNDVFEQFSYDNLNRLTSSSLTGTGANLYQLTGNENQSFGYDAIGNLTYKSDVGHYTYGSGMTNGGSAGVHAMISTTGAINASFGYDDNGNQTGGAGRTTTWSSYNKPVHISKNGAINQFAYGPERQLIYQKEIISSETRETRYIGGIYEETIKGGQTEAVHHLTMAGHTIAVLKTQPTLTNPDETLPVVNSTHYLHQDHLDSVIMITDANGDVIEKNHYDAFGKKRIAIIDAANQPLYAAGFLPITDRSFTDHRYLNGQELIHMKGRVYDPTFGRFLSADPHIQSPLMSQSLNRYSYVLNNPLSLTDPSGYFFSWLKKLFKKIIKAIKKIIKKIVEVIKKVVKAVVKAVKAVVKFVKKYWRQIVAVVVTVVVTVVTFGALTGHTASLAAAWAGGSGAIFGGTAGGLALVGASFVGGFAGGLISTGSLKGALYSGLTAAAFAGVGNYFNGIGQNSIFSSGRAIFNKAGDFVRYGLSRAGQIAKSIAHGVVGGLSNKLSGLSFSKGFLTSFVTEGAGPGINRLAGGNLFLDTIYGGILAGAVSKLAGGSFSTGARLGLFARFFNNVAHTEGGFGQWVDDAFKVFGRVGKFFGSLGFSAATYSSATGGCDSNGNCVDKIINKEVDYWEDGSQPPDDSGEWEWKGTGPPESSGQGNWVHPDGTKVHPDQAHDPPKGPHVGVTYPGQKPLDVYPDGIVRDPKDKYWLDK